MSLITVQGRYKDGKIDLSEAPSGIAEAKVLVTFLPESNTGSHAARSMSYGQFSDRARPLSTEHDFQIAEWHPKPEDLNG